ncbi:carbonic anhydrase 1-like [Leptopilina boulardi]|uniref:carbonic anhydrase 1-like n=1 Tax=Leptopilina boulardi TaxID=63433 RepID=UPI0021F55A95|nr:carbonic anhydrase 1-like [Leptopilina boulardi]
MSHTLKSNSVIISTSSSGYPKWRQSPIDLNCVNVWQRKFPPLLLSGHWKNEGTAIIKNTGETVQVELHDRTVPMISGGPLNDYYEFLYLQFRWGENNSYGAEHSIDNTWYSMEAQAIHWNPRYETLEKCYENSDGIAIISYLFLVSGCDGIADNPEFKNITNSLSSINNVGKSVNISPDSLKWMTNCFYHPGYYTYEGSLTSFPYSQCVTWIVIPRPCKISSNQMEKFRRIRDKNYKPILNNYRTQQPIRGRQIFYANEIAFS